MFKSPHISDGEGEYQLADGNARLSSSKSGTVTEHDQITSEPYRSFPCAHVTGPLANAKRVVDLFRLTASHPNLRRCFSVALSQLPCFPTVSNIICLFVKKKKPAQVRWLRRDRTTLLCPYLPIGVLGRAGSGVERSGLEGFRLDDWIFIALAGLCVLFRLFRLRLF